MRKYWKYGRNYIYEFLNCYHVIINVNVEPVLAVASMIVYCVQRHVIWFVIMRNLEEDCIDFHVDDSERDTDSE